MHDTFQAMNEFIISGLLVHSAAPLAYHAMPRDFCFIIRGLYASRVCPYKRQYYFPAVCALINTTEIALPFLRYFFQHLFQKHIYTILSRYNVYSDSRLIAVLNDATMITLVGLLERSSNVKAHSRAQGTNEVDFYRFIVVNIFCIYL